MDNHNKAIHVYQDSLPARELVLHFVIPYTPPNILFDISSSVDVQTLNSSHAGA